ncbi:MAG: ribosome small subunit-dependent GTPase A [Candidatus Gastranaerophilaceae bacterium]
MRGQVYKIFSDFYYVNTNEGSVECKLRDILKKKSESVIVGDFVNLESVTEDKQQAFISKVLPRKNFLSRPKVANISCAIIVSSLKNPDMDFEQLNRYIAHCEYHKIKPLLCFNKVDLNEDDKLVEEIKAIYEKLGYQTFFTSALLHQGISTIAEFFSGNLTILCGASGVGKSTLINDLTNNSFNLQTKSVSHKTKRGVHTTRHCEIYKINENSSIVDTPGFSNLKFDFLLPQDVQKLFPEFSSIRGCKYNNCLHIKETECKILENISLIAPSRYESYKKFIEEAFEYKKKITYEGVKKETFSKINKGIEMAKLSENKRTLSRKVFKQKVLKTEVENG